jgi:NADH-quinone oxidoreductase subunit E
MPGNKTDHKQHRKENKPVQFSDEILKKLEKIISRYPTGRQKSAMLPVLHIAQEELGGYLTVDIMDYIASLLQVQPIEVYEVATFYSQYYLENVGKYVIEVCHTGPCAICGSETISEYLQDKLNIGVGETTTDGLFTLKEVECLGACGSAPVMQINTEFYENLTEQGIDHLLEEMKSRPDHTKSKETRWAEKFF